MKFVFDHCYQASRSAETYHKLKDRGFATDDHVVEHTGKVFCRFLMFENKNPGEFGRKYHYLEFTELADFEALRANGRKGKTDREMMETGYSLSCSENARLAFEKAQKELSSFLPEFEHKNYRWKEDETSALPGWNFLTFEKNLVADINVWCTEYEPVPGISGTRAVPPQPNGVDGFLGFMWNLPVSDTQSFATFANPEVKRGKLHLDDGLIIYTAESPRFPKTLCARKKSGPFSAVLMSCADWDAFVKLGKPDESFEWEGRRAGLIHMPEEGWDIMVVES